MKQLLKKLAAHLPTIQYRKSFAKDQLDQRLEPFIGRRNGFFIEAGANDGVSQSNTLYYETYFNWTGILVEPSPALVGLCRQNRPKCKIQAVALAPQRDLPPVQLVEAGLWTTSVGAFAGASQGYTQEVHLARAAKALGTTIPELRKVEVPTKTLSQIIDEHNAPKVDLLSLDVEGYELEALKGLDLSRHRPRFILVEERYGTSYEAVLGACYRKDAILSFNEFYQDALYRCVG